MKRHSISDHQGGDHPIKMSAFLMGGGVKNWPNLPTDNSKKLPTEGGRDQKS